MAEVELDALLKRMKEIADAVNAFKSEPVQQAALAALIGAFEASLAPSAEVHKTQAHGKIPDGDAEKKLESGLNSSQATDTGASVRRKRGKLTSVSANVQLVRDLDLHPKGKESFADFVSKKNPGSYQDKVVVVLYYLEEILGINPITVGHVAAVFKQHSGWKEPGNIVSILKNASSRNNTVNKSNLSELSLTAHGRNFVNHDLPAKSGASK